MAGRNTIRLEGKSIPPLRGEFAERIALLEKEAGSRYKLARSTKVSEGSLEKYARGGKPRLDHLRKIARAASVSLDWLVDGKGQMRGDAAATLKDLDGYVIVPRYEVAASAGHGRVVQSERIVDYLAFRSEWLHRYVGTGNKRRLALITAVGDSMVPRIQSDDLLLVLLDPEVPDNGIYVLRRSGQLIVKRLRLRLDGGITISSDNPAYAPDEVPPGEVETVDVIGRVIWIGSSSML